MMKVLVIISAVIISLFMPAALLKVPVDLPSQKINLIVELPSAETPSINLLVDGAVHKLPLEEYLIGVILAEMPPSFHMEALKAQAVAARTFALSHLSAGSKHPNADLCSDSACCQAWYDKETIMERFGSEWKIYWDRAMAAVLQTKGEVLQYQGELIDAVYFSCSGGCTEDAVAVWGAEIPYLQSVTSSGEEACNKFNTQNIFSPQDFKEIIGQQDKNLQLIGPPSSWFGEAAYTKGGGIDTLKIGGKSYKGTQLRQLFGLNSTKFSVQASDEQIVFYVYGYGHRVGMSQYGANAMAEAGKTYDEILKHYYTSAEIVKAP